MVGLIEDASNRVTQGFKKDNDVIVLLGSPSGDLAGSEYLYHIHRLKKGNPAIDIEFEKAVQAACLEAIAARLVRSAHDLSEGGLAVGVAESCISDPEELRGAVLDLDALAPPGNRLDEMLFGEAPSRIVLTVEPNDLVALENIAARHSVPCLRLGSVAGDHLVVKHRGSLVIDLRVQDLSDTWRGAIPRRTGMPSPSAAGGDANLRHIYYRIQEYIDKNWD